MSVSSTNQALQQLHYIPWNLSSRPWERLLIDYAGVFESQYLLISAHSNWIEVLPDKSSSSSVTIELLCTVFAQFGLPEFIVLSCFVSDDFVLTSTGSLSYTVRLSNGLTW